MISRCEHPTRGAVDKLVLPDGMRRVNFRSCVGITGAVDKLVLPVGMQNLNLRECWGLTGTLATLPPPRKIFTILRTGVKIDVAAIEWPANATALISKYDALVCRIKDPGAWTSEICIKCNKSQVMGDIGQMILPVGMKTVNFSGTEVTGAVDKLVLPSGMQSVNFRSCGGLTGELPASERAKVKTYYGPRD